MSFPYGSVTPPAGQVSGNALPVEYMFSQIMGAVQKSVSFIHPTKTFQTTVADASVHSKLRYPISGRNAMTYGWQTRAWNVRFGMGSR